MPAYAIISDVHANLEALQAVLTEIEKEDIDSLLFTGDCVGYGPDPNECVELIRYNASIMIAGNHDWGAVGLTEVKNFNPHARVVIDWTRDVLSKQNFSCLHDLPLTEKISADRNIFLVHGTPKEPDRWHYFSFEYDAKVNFRYFDEQICFLGHSHTPFIVERSPRGKTRSFYARAEVNDNCRYIVNTGSVGQPRDGNPDASYILFKDDVLEIKRVSYDILLTQKKMKKAGLPSYLIARLAKGR
jgi:predicted phosphodiesterase